MKSSANIRFILLCFIASYGILTSCADEEDLSVRRAFFTCAENIDFLVSESAFSSNRDLSLSIDQPFQDGPKAALAFREPSFINQNNVSKIFLLSARLNEVELSITLEINVLGENDCIPLGMYHANSLSTSQGILFFDYTNSQGLYTLSSNQSNGVLEITECDFNSGSISGNFSATLVHSANGTENVVEITEGQFENVCFAQE